MQTRLISDILPTQFLNEVVHHLCSNVHWALAFDNPENDVYHNLFYKKQHLGFTFTSENDPQQIFLNTVAKIVVHTVAEKLNVKLQVQRFMWNMYYPGQNGKDHDDRPEDNYLSILYNLHECDGGTEIDGKFYPDVLGQAKVFKSNLIHRGIGPKESFVRFNLNVICRYETND
jgi:hypothetical protein